MKLEELLEQPDKYILVVNYNDSRATKIYGANSYGVYYSFIWNTPKEAFEYINYIYKRWPEASYSVAQIKHLTLEAEEPTVIIVKNLSLKAGVGG